MQSDRNRDGRVGGKTAIVTGGAGGIGSATARALAREGASVAVLDIDSDRCEQVAESIRNTGAQAIAVAVDLSAEAAVVGAIRSVTDRFGRLDILHNNAAMTDSDFLTKDTSVTDLDLGIWERTLAVNLTSQMLMCKHCIPEMVKNGGGSIINMSSGASLRGDWARTSYGVSKGGVNTLTIYVATSHGKQNIRANTIVPGLIMTDALRAHLSDEIVEGFAASILTTHLGEPEDIAHTVVFLASDESRYITAQIISVDGGIAAHM